MRKHLLRRRRGICVDAKDILEHDDGVKCSPKNAAAEERADQEEPVDELDFPACELEFIAEPVDVEERRRELEEDEDAGVVVHERALLAHIS